MGNILYRLALILYFCITIHRYMKIFNSTQIHELDRYTVEHEPITSLDLMERAAKAIALTIMQRWPKEAPFVVFAGPGNNGGDALAVARLLAEEGYVVSVFLFNIHNHLSDDCAKNKQRLLDSKRIKAFNEVIVDFEPPRLDADTVVVDGLFGSGLNKPIVGGFASLVKYINQCKCKVVSIDLPSGLMTEDNTYNIRQNIVRADLTLTIQQLKLSMLMADCQQYLGEVRVLDIRLSPDFIAATDTPYSILEETDIRSRLRERNVFAHKGNMGTALLIAGSYGMAGAAVLATKACLRAGVGQVIVHTPKRNCNILQTSVPEAVLQIDKEETIFSEPVNTEDYEAVAMGPGLGQNETSAIALIAQIRRTQCPMVLDADALNILGVHRAWMQQLPEGIVMTPHVAEFDRLEGTMSNGCYDRLSKAIALAEGLHGYILLKGHYSALCTPDGKVYFNPTGNAGMATAGSGDVLTGIIAGLLAQGYSQEDASLIGMYLHGLAGDLAVRDLGQESLIASDLIEYLPKAFARIKE